MTIQTETRMTQLSAGQLIGANFSFQHYPFDEVARIIRGFGLVEIELWGIAPHLDLFHADDASVTRVKRMLEANGLSTHCFTPEQVIYPINIASGDDRLRDDSISRFCRAAEICAELGARYLFLTPGRGFENESADRAWGRSAEALNQIATYAGTLGVRCLLEPLQRVESKIVTNAAALRRMLDMAGVATMDVVLDTVAMATAGDTVADYLRLFGDRLVHVHVVDGTPAGHLVWGDGNLPLGTYLRELAGAGYGGQTSLEPVADCTHALPPAAASPPSLRALPPFPRLAPRPA